MLVIPAGSLITVLWTEVGADVLYEGAPSRIPPSCRDEEGAKDGNGCDRRSVVLIVPSADAEMSKSCFQGCANNAVTCALHACV